MLTVVGRVVELPAAAGPDCALGTQAVGTSKWATIAERQDMA